VADAGSAGGDAERAMLMAQAHADNRETDYGLLDTEPFP